MCRREEGQHQGVRDDMDVDAEQTEHGNPEAETEEHIEAEAEAEMHHLRNMVRIMTYVPFFL